jgi:RNA polymerase sigma-70 factor (ECF subfamily)
MTSQIAQTLEPGFAGLSMPFAAAEAPEPDGGLMKLQPRELEQYRTQLTRYALWLLGSRDAAEDAVQDTLLAALHAPQSFSGRSSVRTWLFGILKHKVMDTFRRQSREVALEDDGEEDIGDGVSPFTEDGHWRSAPSHWGDPEATLNQKRFFEILERSISRLPKNTARVFTMREIMGMETAEICATVGITRENCFVMLHRARMALRNLLERDWGLEGLARQ